ncbi:MAG: NAD(P)H-dependent oxidoreductase subunit E, partial [Verrucomicrobiales bacterium]|nr:NAD(P)H-dependent oxidoreductase subunit E [Verrucomicrobiales bacterium]
MVAPESSTAPADKQLIDRWRDEPAPLLPLLHAFHDRDGHLSEPALRAVSDALRIPIAELFGTVTFYHHFSQQPDGKNQPRVCTGNVCCLNGGNQILETLASEPGGAVPMPCAGRCDSMVPVIVGDKVLTGTTAESLTHTPTPVPPPNPGEIEECCFRHIRKQGRHTLDGYRATGGYAAFENALKNLTPEDVINVVTESKLAGRGGAGFPTGIKWKAVRDAGGDPKSIVC